MEHVVHGPGRRALLAAGLGAALAAGGCTNWPGASRGVAIVASSGAPVSRAQALASMRLADHLLLGEVHDNPVHHRERAAMLVALADRAPVAVFEQFSRGADAALSGPVAGDLDAWLDRAKFDRQGWGWPLHRPLIDAALAQGMPIRGGNLPREQVQRIAREGIAAAPVEMRARLQQGLPAQAAAVLDLALRDGHCGRLPASLLPRLRDAQMARDIAMADALVQASAGRTRPTVLIAGNGHVRRDHGVPLWLASEQPGARVLSVGFLERAVDGSHPAPPELAVHDLVWITDRIDRVDPCKSLPLPPSPTPLAPALVPKPATP